MGTFTLTQLRESADLFLFPSANGCNIDLTPTGEATNWECVDDPKDTPDDSTYNYSINPNLEYDLYALPNHTTETGTINYIQVFARAKAYEIAQDEDGIYKIIITDNACADIYKSDDKDLTTSYVTLSKVWTENPRTSIAWTWGDADNIQIGLECNSPTRSNVVEILTIRPNGIGDVTELLPIPYGGGTKNWMNVDEVDMDGDTTTNRLLYTYIEGYDIYHMENHTTEIGVITKIVVFAWVKPVEIEDRRSKTVIKIGGSTHYGNYDYRPVNVWTLISTEYILNPTTSLAWTWDDIDNLQAGIFLGDGPGFGDTHYMCTQVYVAVHHIEGTVNPEIRTTQCYAKINYTPPEAECTLNKPEEINVNHTENVKILNFWNGTREVYGLNRSGKSMVLTGSEYQSDTCNKACPCERITCVKEMGKDGSTITISGLRSLFNGDYKIRSFGWKHISEKPEYYEWILELEYDD